MTLAEISTHRLEQIISKNKNQIPKQLLPIIKNELLTLFQNFFVVKGLSVDILVVNGEFEINIQAKATQTKKINFIS